MRPRPVVGEATVPDAVRRLLDKFDYPDHEALQQVIPILPTVGGGDGTGAHVHLVRSTTQTIAVGGSAVSWTAFHAPISPVAFAVSLPTASVPIGRPGYYNVAVQLGWDSFTDGGTVWIVRSRSGVETRVWPPTEDPGLWTTTDGQYFEGEAPAIPCEVADQIKVYVDHNDVGTKDLASATCAIYLVDRDGVLIVTCPILAARVTVSASGNHDGFPGYAVAGTTHIVAYREGAGHTSTDGVIKVRLSTDSGATWGAASTEYTNAAHDAREGILTTLADGRVVMAVGVQDNTGASIQDGGFTLISSDDGATWTAGIQIDDGGFTDWSLIQGGICELANGDWLLAITGANSGDSRRIRVLSSSDDGTTWTVVASEVADGDNFGDPTIGEANIIRSGDQLMMLMRDNDGSGFGFKIWRLTSTGDGSVWSAPAQVLNAIGGSPRMMLRTNGDVVTLLRGNPNADYPPVLLRSGDFGITWESCEQFVGDKLAYGQPAEDATGKLGIAYAIETGASPTSDSTVYFRRES